MISLGIESTAHTFGAGIIDDKGKVLANVKDLYTTKKGAIFPEKSGKLDFNKYLPNKKFTTEIVIYGRKVALIAHKNKPIGVIIEDEAVSSTAKVIFELVWDLLK